MTLQIVGPAPRGTSNRIRHVDHPLMPRHRRPHDPLQPTKRGHGDDFLKAVDAHSDAREVAIRLTGLLAEVEARGASKVTLWSQLRHGSQSHTDSSRRALHGRIADEAVAVGSGGTTTPVAAFVLGPPGAGKTSVGVPFVRDSFGAGFVVVNADDVKEALPEYDGWNAAGLHDESAYIAEHLVLQRALAQQCNVLLDMTGRDGRKVAARIAEMAGFGFRPYVLLLDLPPWLAARRAWERFQANPFRRHDPHKPPGRWVPPDYVLREVKDHPLKGFRRLRNLPDVAGWCRINAAASQPASPAVVETDGWPIPTTA